MTIAEVKIHPSYVAKCKTDVCGFGKLEASDAPDIAVILLKNDLDTVPSVPVDLDPVGQADPLLLVTSGCTTLDGQPAAGPKTVKTIAVPAKSVNHAGSPYATAPALVTRLASSYVVTAGAGWRSTEPRLCNGDVSSPIFRAGSAAVAGVTANYTTYAGGEAPGHDPPHARRRDVPLQDRRLALRPRRRDDALLQRGLRRLREAQLRRRRAHGPRDRHEGRRHHRARRRRQVRRDRPRRRREHRPPTAAPPDPPVSGDPHSDQLPTEDTGEGADTSGEEDYSDAAAPTKKKKTAAGGCSTAPGAPAPAGEMFLALGAVLGAAIIRRRRK